MPRLVLYGAALLLAMAASASAADPVKRIDIYVQPYYAAAASPDGAPQVSVGETFSGVLASNRQEDIIAARDLVERKPELITPMTIMALAIRLYDVGLRDDSVFWFYVAKERYITLASVINIEAAGLSEVDAAMNAFVQLAGPFINGYAFCDISRQAAAHAASIDWVEAHPYQVIFSDKLPAYSDDRAASLAAAVANLRDSAAKEGEYLSDPDHLAAIAASRAKNEADAKFCWK